MAKISPEIMSDINHVLNAIRSALDMSSNLSLPAGSDIFGIRDAYLRFENVRFDFRVRTVKYRTRSVDASDPSIRDLHDGLYSLVKDKDFEEIVARLYYRPVGFSRSRRSSWLHPALRDRIPLQEAIFVLMDSLADLPTQSDLDLQVVLPDIADLDPVARLRKIVPKQQSVAPLQFGITRNKLSVVPQVGIPEHEDLKNSRSAKEQLIANGEKIIEQLNVSNCDKRLIETVLELQTRLSSGEDIIRLGLSNIGCEIMCNQFSSELPVAVSAMMKSQTQGIGMFVAQFPEWHRFTEQAAAAEISKEDAPIISQALSGIIERFRDTPEVCDPEVPKLLQALNSLISDPELTTKRAVYAVWRSVENLAITVFNYGSEFLTKTVNKTVDSLSTAASRAIVVALMTAALSGAITLSPIASNIPGSAWIAKAVDAVKSQIESLVKK